MADYLDGVEQGTGSTAASFETKTTTEMAELSASAGDTIYNSDYGILFSYNGTTWQASGATTELQNKSGGSLASGDVVVYKTVDARSCNTTTTSNDKYAAGVVIVGGAADAWLTIGRTLTGVTVNITGSATINDWLKPSTTEKLGQANTSATAGVFGICLVGGSGTAVFDIWDTELL
jgi:hypothetical protein